MSTYYIKRERGYWKIIAKRPRTFLEKLLRKEVKTAMYLGAKGEWYTGKLFENQVDKKTAKYLDSVLGSAWPMFKKIATRKVGSQGP